MGIKAKILADSIGPAGIRLTTWELTYPRFIHSELLTYAFSRNAASSRAIPVRKMMERIRKDPVTPVYWGANQAGMQANTELKGFRRWLAPKIWIMGCYLALFTVWVLNKLNVHKQIANRVTEPWMYITTVVTADQYSFANMWHQRDHSDAQPEFRCLARKMWVEYNMATPKALKLNEWHLPFIDDEDRRAARTLILGQNAHKGPPSNKDVTEEEVNEVLKQVSVGRCARVSYLNHNGVRNIREDVALHNKMKNSKPGHWSPFEHIASALAIPATQAKLRGWRPYRMDFQNEFLCELPTWNPRGYGKEIAESLEELSQETK